MDLSMSFIEKFTHLDINKSGGDTYNKYDVQVDPYEITKYDIIDVDNLVDDDDETWLYSPPQSNQVSPSKINIKKWLEDATLNQGDKYKTITKRSNVRGVTPPKNVDTRTFTRPKKRFSRPSIERYNEELFGASSKVDEEVSEPEIVPDTGGKSTLSFELNKPVNSHYFDKVFANVGDVDSFLNMSPPSLVNSMCSSTFTNLMESSFIRNDPVLREIRDTDFESILMHESEPNLYTSLTESCSSINSDTPENFLRKMSFRNSFKKSLMKDFGDSLGDSATQNYHHVTSVENTMIKSSGSETKSRSNTDTDDWHDAQTEPLTETTKLSNSGTYRRSGRRLSSQTFRKTDREKLNRTFEFTNEDDIVTKQNGTFNTKPIPSSDKLITSDSIENIKKGLHDSFTDLNRVDYEQTNNVDDHNGQFNNDMNKTIHLSPLVGCSVGSADSLDRMSSYSNSSRGSTKMLNEEEVSANVAMQEQSLQIMSTPKPNFNKKLLWENNFISPITSNKNVSDSETSSTRSSTEDFKSVKSSLSKLSLESNSTRQLQSQSFLSVKTIKQRSINTLGGPRNLQTMANNLRASYSNLQSAPLSNLQKMGSQSNLKTALKGSYTSLRPISANLPVAPPLKGLNSTKTFIRGSDPNLTHTVADAGRIAEVAPTPRGSQVDGVFAKPAPPRASGLPRPAGRGIPRPVSRIPGPRASSARPAPVSRFGLSRPSKNEDYY